MFSSFILSNYIWEVDLEGKEKFGLTFLCPKTILNMKKPHLKNILTCSYVPIFLYGLPEIQILTTTTT